MNDKKYIPFGLMFEETLNNNVYYSEPFYDEDQDISVLIDQNGNSVPYVENENIVNTGTVTKVVSEDSDSDETFQQINTRTLTEIKNEDSGDDDASFLFGIATKTDTFDVSENSDSDNDETTTLLMLSTRTDTRIQNEETDDDEV